MSIKIIGGPEIKTNQQMPPVTPLDNNFDDEDYDYDNDNDGSDITMNNVYFAIVIALILMVLYHLTDVKKMLKDIFSE